MAATEQLRPDRAEDGTASAVSEPGARWGTAPPATRLANTYAPFVARAGTFPELIGTPNGKPRFRPHTIATVRLPLLDVPMLDDRPRDACGRPRSQATMPTFRRGRKPNNAGKSYPPTPPSADQMLAILAQGSPTCPADIRNRALFGLIWRSGLRVSEALDLEPGDLTWPSDGQDGCVLVKRGKGGKRRISPMDAYGFELVEPWIAIRGHYPVGPLFSVVEGKTKGGRVNASTVRAKLHQWAQAAGVERVVGDEVYGRVAPHQLRHGFACDSVRDDIPVVHVSKALGHSNLAVTTTYLQAIAPAETIAVYGARPRPRTLEATA